MLTRKARNTDVLWRVDMDRTVFAVIVIVLVWARIGIMIAKKKSQEIEWHPMGPND